MAEALKLASPKVDTSKNLHGRFVVAQITLETGESLPLLIRKSDWIPLRVPTRWAVRRRRFECMKSTLSRDLRGIALLYEWGMTTLKIDLDDMLECSEIPPGGQLESLITFLRHNATGSTAFNSLATVALKAISIRTFLMWVADPANQGSPRSKSAQQLTEERTKLTALFHPIEKYTVSSERIRPLLPNELDAIDTIIGPVRDERQIAEMYFSLREDVRNVFLEGQLQAVHVTPLGLWVHDFKLTPCPKFLKTPGVVM